MNRQPTLRGELLELRPLRAADFEPLFAVAADPLVWEQHPEHDRWREWAATLTEERAGSVLDYKDLKGNAWRQPVWQLILHVVNHATHHRGQVSGFLRAMGHTPPPVDLIAYYRTAN